MPRIRSEQVNAAFEPEVMEAMRVRAEDRDVPIATLVYSIVRRVVMDDDLYARVFAVKPLRIHPAESSRVASTINNSHPSEDDEEASDPTWSGMA